MSRLVAVTDGVVAIRVVLRDGRVLVDDDAVLADFGLYHPEADLRWIDHTAAPLDQLAQVTSVNTTCPAAAPASCG
jgi:hypothetical protein